MSSHTVKRVLCLHDLACVGRCSLSVAGPVLSVMGVQACLLPVTLLSTHTAGFGIPADASQTAFCRAALAHFCAQQLSFDAVYSGYLANAAQAQLVHTAFAQSPSALKLVDPVLGDAGKLYSALAPALTQDMVALCESADYLVPNVTESALLLGLAPADTPMDSTQWTLRMRALAKRFPRAKGIVLTGARHADGRWGNCCYAAAQGAPVFLPFAHAPQSFPGTGDLFASALLGGLLRGDALLEAAQRAAAFVGAAAHATCAAEAAPCHGVLFEPLLGTLLDTGSCTNLKAF